MTGFLLGSIQSCEMHDEHIRHWLAVSACLKWYRLISHPCYDVLHTRTHQHFFTERLLIHWNLYYLIAPPNKYILFDVCGSPITCFAKPTDMKWHSLAPLRTAWHYSRIRSPVRELRPEWGVCWSQWKVICYIIHQARILLVLNNGSCAMGSNGMRTLNVYFEEYQHQKFYVVTFLGISLKHYRMSHV